MEMAKTDDVILKKETNYLLVEFTGEFGVESGKRVVDAMLTASTQCKRDRVVLDCRKMTGKMPLFAKFEVAVYGGKVVGTISRLAIIGRPELIEPDRFVSTVAKNRGLNVEIFSDFIAGVDWVLGGE